MTGLIGQSVASRRRVWTGRGFAWFVGLVVGALLPFSPMTLTTPVAHADPPVFDGKEIKDLCTINANGQSCPVFPPPPGLINSGALAAAGPEVAQSMRILEDQAVANTLADHQLPASDAEAVRSWGRDDAEAELWALIVEAINTSEAERTTDQQHAAEWMMRLASAQANDAAMQAGAEYATWAGLDVNDYWRKARTATKGELTTFLSRDVLPFSPLFTQRGGYCRYTPPDPYSDDYDGSQTQSCFVPCSFLACVIPTPKYDDFVKWGQAAASNKTLSDTSLQAQMAQIAEASMYAAVGVAAAVVVGSALTAVLTSAAVMTAIFSTVILEQGINLVAVTGTSIGSAAGAAAIAGAVLIILVAIVTAVLEGIRVSDNAALPGKVAELVVNARTAVTDPATLIGTTEGATSLFTMFVGATLPRPRYDLACDNSLIPPWAYTSSFDPNLLIYVPLGENKAILSPTDRSGCLNPPPVPPASPTDAHFVVTPRGSLSPPQVAPTIRIGGAPSGATQQVRLTGNWFVGAITAPGGAPRTWQSLTLDYYDWDGVGNVAWLVRDGAGNQTFIGGQAPDDGTTLDPDTCQDDGTCWESDHIEYVGTDGHDYTASIETFQPATGSPTYSPSDPVEASPVTFSAADFAPGSSEGGLTYSWRFQALGCGWAECLSGPQTPSFEGPFEGETVDYTWQSIGPAKVELTATDQKGHSATTVFVVDVGNVAPHIVALHENEASVGTPVQLQGAFGDAGAKDDVNIEINFGDGQKKQTRAGPNSPTFADSELTVLRLGSDASWGIRVDHTYTQPGTYYGTMTVSDWGGGTDFATFVVRVTGKQTITFPAVADHDYGDVVEMPATGSASSSPVAYTAGPDSVCQSAGDDGEAIKLVGLGTCTVTAHQEADPPLFLAADPVQQTFEVGPADLTIRAQDKTKVYGSEDPVFTATYDGLVNGDTKDDVTGLVVTGPPSSAHVGEYKITPSGATSPNYAIRYLTGTETITPAPLTITADDQTKVYGGDDPVFTARFEGLVNHDRAVDFASLAVAGAPSDADVGLYEITASGVEIDTDNYEITYVTGTETITPAPLTIRPEDKTKVYGADDPAFTAKFDGLVNGDTRVDLTGLVLDGAPSDADVGEYEITASGAQIDNDNYEIKYLTGTETITPAPLTIRADDKTKIYGADNPPFTATYDGLVNGDTADGVHGLTLSGAPAGAGVGRYPIEPSGATNPNYDIDYATGTETITPAPLTIEALDVTVASGRMPSYAWTGKGWVNGDSDATLAQPPNRSPSCSAVGVGPTGPSAVAPGVYPAAITCSGAVDPDYEIAYRSATLTVNPTITLKQLGLPDDVAHKAYLDRSPVALPIVARQVGYGTRHTFRFPTVVLGDDGTTYVTSRIRHDGQVTENINVTASYITMRQLVLRATGEQAIGKREAKRLLHRWQGLEAHIAANHNAKAQKALHQFADEVRDQTGASIRAATAQDLITYAQAVYVRIGGAGTI